MQLRAIMTPEVEVIPPEATLQQAAAKMRPPQYRPAARL